VVYPNASGKEHFAKNGLEKGMPEKLIMERTGHCSLKPFIAIKE